MNKESFFKNTQKEIKEIQDLINLRMQFCKSIVESIKKFQKRLKNYRN